MKHVLVNGLNDWIYDRSVCLGYESEIVHDKMDMFLADISIYLRIIAIGLYIGL